MPFASPMAALACSCSIWDRPSTRRTGRVPWSSTRRRNRTRRRVRQVDPIGQRPSDTELMRCCNDRSREPMRSSFAVGMPPPIGCCHAPPECSRDEACWTGQPRRTCIMAFSFSIEASSRTRPQHSTEHDRQHARNILGEPAARNVREPLGTRLRVHGEQRAHVNPSRLHEEIDEPRAAETRLAAPGILVERAADQREAVRVRSR